MTVSRMLVVASRISARRGQGGPLWLTLCLGAHPESDQSATSFWPDRVDLMGLQFL